MSRGRERAEGVGWQYDGVCVRQSGGLRMWGSGMIAGWRGPTVWSLLVWLGVAESGFDWRCNEFIRVPWQQQ